jgi:hypothetical protein
MDKIDVPADAAGNLYGTTRGLTRGREQYDGTVFKWEISR